MPTVTVNASAALLVQAGPRSPAQDVAKGVIPNCGNWYSVIRQKMALFPFCGTRTFPGRSLTCKFGSNRTTDSSPAQPSQSDDEALNVANSLILRKQQWLQRLAEDPESFREIEQEIDEGAGLNTGRFMAALIQEASHTKAFQSTCQRIQQDVVDPVRNGSKRKSKFRLRCGLVLFITTLYCPPKRLTAKQAKAQTERRVGLFPELAPLASASDARPS